MTRIGTKVTSRNGSSSVVADHHDVRLRGTLRLLSFLAPRRTVPRQPYEPLGWRWDEVGRSSLVSRLVSLRFGVTTRLFFEFFSS